MNAQPDGHDASMDSLDAPAPDAESVEVRSLTIVEEEIVVEVRRQAPPPLHSGVSWLLLDRARSMMSLLVVAVFALTFLAQPFRIPSESMERTLLVGDFLLVNKAIYGPAGVWGWLLPYREPLRGDIVVFRFPLDPEDHVVKRVIGVTGDRLHLRDGVVYRDGTPLQEPYTIERPDVYRPGYDAFRDDFPVARFTDPGVDAHWWMVVQRTERNNEIVVPAGSYFVMGDNRDHSRDSRYWGYVPREDIVGMPMLIYFSVREPSRTDPPRAVEAGGNDRLGKSEGSGFLDFARWERTLRVVR
jgi:signal peptidase I